MNTEITITIRLNNLEKINANISALQRAIPRCDPQGVDPILLQDTISILEGIKKEIAKKSRFPSITQMTYV